MKMEQDLTPQPGQELDVTEEVGRQLDNFGRPVPEDTGTPIFIDRRRLWNCFFGYSLSVRRDLADYLDILHAIQEASSSGSAITNTPWRNRLTQFLSSRFRWFRTPPAARDRDVKPDRMMLKINKDMAVSNLSHMLDFLDIAKMLPKPSRPLFSLRRALWTVSCAVLLGMTYHWHWFIAHPHWHWLVVNLLGQGTAFSTVKLLKPLAWDILVDYNLNRLEKELQDLKREFENGTISEKNRKAMDSWHMEFRSFVR
ncbi:hypothetical protein CEP54_002732 [Fusarium duplospermum]|uniref:Uncharacterized protein n=1 Tax=Fusarium duplospermum TaxID=1325734 RepID=A0A428QU14_9HYPO|nr:hypothetical protein CEP54_002732 [Fusarium duplospermum]